MGAAFSFAKGVTANFTFGTGKFGDLAGFTSAIVLAMISILIGYESVTRTHGHGQHSISTPSGDLILEVFEEGVPPRFRLRAALGPPPAAETTLITTVRPDGTEQEFALVPRGNFLE